MERSTEILTELQQIAPVLRQNDYSRLPYSLPIGYFKRFPHILMERIRLEESKDKERVKDMPEISSRQEIAEISALLAGLQHKNPYQVPEGYFETLHNKMPSAEAAPFQEILRKIPTGSTGERAAQSGSPAVQKAPVVHFSRIIKYSVAACIVALLGLNLFNLPYHNHQFTDPIRGLRAVSDQDMANYLDAYDIHWTPGLGNSSETAAVDFSDTDIHTLFSNVGDDELQEYMPPLSEEKGTVN